MTNARDDEWMTAEEYLDFEAKSNSKHEFVDGLLFAMTGTTQRHNTIVHNLDTIVANHLHGSKCRAYRESIRVAVEAANSYYYPDLVVTCKPDDDSFFALEPLFIAEVLSDSTAMIDRREKVAAYRKLPSLCEYLIVDHRKQQAQLFRRQHDKAWASWIFRGNAEFSLDSLPTGLLVIRLPDLYKATDLEHHQGFEVREERAGYFI